jgi:uncharacterized protein YgfB (UPF0149 family)
LPLFQGSVFVLKLIADLHERVYTLLEPFQFVLKHCIYVFRHGGNIEPLRNRINHQVISGVVTRSIPWDHSSMTAPIAYDELDASLRRCGSNWNAGQAHGLLCSQLAVLGAPAGAGWLQLVLEGVDAGNALRQECAGLLDQLYSSTCQQLAERQSDFKPFLPDEQAPALARAEAMGQWCEGFLHGLVSEAKGDALRKRLATEPMDEIIKDLLEITRAVMDDDAGSEENEVAYAELFEYLRVAAQLAYEQLADLREPSEDAPQDPSGQRVLH